MNTIKCVVVGDQTVGKTCILTNKCPSESSPTLSDKYTQRIMLAGESYILELFDTPSSDEYARLRPLIYKNADIFLICFSVVDYFSVNAVKYKWVPEIMHHCSNTPSFILVGTKIDLRNDPTVLNALVMRNEKAVNFKKALSILGRTYKLIPRSCYLWFGG